MIVAIGLDVDDTFARFVQLALEWGIPIKAINLRAAVEGAWRFDVPSRSSAVLEQGGEAIEIRPDDSFFCRLIDLSSQQAEADSARRWQGLLSGLRAWLDSAPGRVANRSLAGVHNGSKPLHEAVLRDLGFRVPESLTGSDPDELRCFTREGPTLSKTVCGVRADAVKVTEADFDGFRPESGPVHLQRFVAGDDARVHVAGHRLVAQRVSAGSVDYRLEGGFAGLEVFEPPGTVRELLIEGTRRLGLELAGWDFKIDADGEFWCLEANSMPGYSPYDHRCDGAITRALLLHLGAELPEP